MTLRPWPTYLLIAGLGMTLGIAATTVAIAIAWSHPDFPEQAGPARFEQLTPAQAGQLTLVPTVHAAAPEPTPLRPAGGTPEPRPHRPGFKYAVRYEALLPSNNNQAFSDAKNHAFSDAKNHAFSDARKKRHADSQELRTELLVQLDTLNLQAQFQEGIQLNTESNFREGQYVRFVFDDTGEQDEAIRNMIMKLRRSSPAGFIHLRAYEISYRDH